MATPNSPDRSNSDFDPGAGAQRSTAWWLDVRPALGVMEIQQKWPQLDDFDHPMAQAMPHPIRHTLSKKCHALAGVRACPLTRTQLLIRFVYRPSIIRVLV